MNFEFTKFPENIDYGPSTLEERAMARNILLRDPDNVKLPKEDLEKLVAAEVNPQD